MRHTHCATHKSNGENQVEKYVQSNTLPIYLYKIVIVCVQEKGGVWRANKNTTHLSEE